MAMGRCADCYSKDCSGCGREMEEREQEYEQEQAEQETQSK